MALFDVKKAIGQAKAQGPNMTEAKTGGGDYVPPAEGFVRLRFVGYIELGNKETEYKGVKSVKPHAELIFELSGPKHEPKKLDDGTLVPHRITEKVKVSLNEKARFFQLFTEMNYDKDATHIAELLGKPFVGRIEHKKETKGGKEIVYANLRDIRAPFIDNMDDEGNVEKKAVNVAPAITELKLFLWDFATPEMWDSLFIPGEYEARTDKDGKVTQPARTKNVIQKKITEALNWKGCPVYDYANAKMAGDTATADAAAALDAAMEEGVTTVAVPDAANDADDLAGVA